MARSKKTKATGLYLENYITPAGVPIRIYFDPLLFDFFAEFDGVTHRSASVPELRKLLSGLLLPREAVWIPVLFVNWVGGGDESLINFYLQVEAGRVATLAHRVYYTDSDTDRDPVNKCDITESGMVIDGKILLPYASERGWYLPNTEETTRKLVLVDAYLRTQQQQIETVFRDILTFVGISYDKVYDMLYG